jgi:subtilisin family serine protease
MKPYDPKTRPVSKGKPSDLLRIAVTFPRAAGAGPVKFGARLSVASAREFAPDPLKVDQALGELQRRGLSVTARGRLAVSMRCTRGQYEQLFGTKLEVFESPARSAAQSQRFYFPGPTAPWQPDASVSDLIDDAYIQWPHLYMGSARKAGKLAGGVGGGPKLGYHYLGAPKGVQSFLNVGTAHKQKITGQGVRLAMIDSGFDQRHAWFKKYRAQSAIVLAAGATNRATDLNGHGSGESANIFSIAPGVTFIGVKVDNDATPEDGASILEGFQEALRHKPHIISVSMGYDLRTANERPLAKLPNNLVALEAEIQAAVAAGIIVVFSAGNGHYAFPGQMPNVISAGGVYVDAKGAMQASDYASAFPSAIYAGRSVPDFCGLVGLQPDATYIRLPIPKGCEIDRDMALADKTSPTDGWGVFSGTSAAAPQIAGLCALLLQKNPSLTPQEVKAVLRRSARDVSAGRASASSDPAQAGGVRASAGTDGATGAGLVDVAAALRQVS